MGDLESRAKKVVEKAVTREGILSFLRVMVENRQLSLKNLLLVFEQNPEAKAVCGKGAWEQLGRKAKAEVAPIWIMLPEILESQIARYRPVKVYDYDSTEGQELKVKQSKVAFADRITQLTKATWEIVPEAVMKGSLDRGFYDEERNVFCLSELCVGDQQEQTILGLYIDYVFEIVGVSDRFVKMAVSFVVYESFDLKHTIVGALFGKVGKFTVDEKWEFLKSVWWMSKRVLDDLEGCVLTFNEVAFINSLLITDEPGEVERLLEQVADSVGDAEVRDELLVLKIKLSRVKVGCLVELYRQRCRMQLFTYPPILLEFEDDDYLREERRAYDAGYGHFTED